MSFSPKENTGTRFEPLRRATLIKPRRFLTVSSAVPGKAWRDSAAPPTTIMQEWPGPLLRMLSQERRLTDEIPRTVDGG